MVSIMESGFRVNKYFQLWKRVAAATRVTAFLAHQLIKQTFVRIFIHSMISQLYMILNVSTLKLYVSIYILQGAITRND